LLAIDSLGEKISNNLQSGKQPLFGVAFPFMWPFWIHTSNLSQSHLYEDWQPSDVTK